ncbi:hypothetical protein B0T17DRAFT_614913 [Bombardia bombarda]|uniref:Uncharacterized protein n=1 Tax=Bombardia bombarda TaxID=252184 RepID=A0AA39X850_9PEZI|nr:hypothetical protein B0T17DRAFT_614913 [Bombardia bombarda]
MAATTSAHTNPHGWHQGEAAVHHLLKVPTTTSRQNPTSAGLPPQYAYRTAGYPLVAVGTLDAHGRPWTSLWGGERGVARPVAQGVLALESLVDRVNDPAVQALFGGDGGELVDGVRQLQEQDGSGGKMMSGLGIDLEARTRLKLAGRMAVGDLEGRPDGDGDEGGGGLRG